MITENKPKSRPHRAGIERPEWFVARRRLRLPGTAVGQGMRGEGLEAGQERCGEGVAAGQYGAGRWAVGTWMKIFCCRFVFFLYICRIP